MLLDIRLLTQFVFAKTKTKKEKEKGYCNFLSALYFDR